MSSLSDLNKKERKIKGNISSLRRQLREKKLSNREFNRMFETYNKELESISEEKSKLIGMPPMPPPPRPDRPSGGSGLSEIKKSILGGNDEIEPPGPPVLLKTKLPDIPKPPKKVEVPVFKEKIKEVPVFKEKIKEVPVFKEKIKEVPVFKEKIKKVKAPPIKDRIKKVEVPVFKERIKKVPVFKDRIKKVEVPVIKEVIKEVPVFKERIKEVPVFKERIREVKVPVFKTVKVPAGDPKLASNIRENLKEIGSIKLDVVKQGQKCSQLASDVAALRKDLQSLENLKAEVRALDMILGKMDFQGLSKDIYNQLKITNELIEQKARNSQDSGRLDEIREMVNENTSSIRNVQADLIRRDQEVSKYINEISSSAEKLGKIDEMKSSVESLKSRIDKIDFKGLSEDIYSQFEKMNTGIKGTDKRTDDAVEKLNVEIKTLNEKMNEVSNAKEHVDNLDITNIRRDMEIIKQKNQFLEQHLERVDIRPIVSMIKDVELKVNNLQASSALIIE
jgi:prefoldin subunit 5/Rieske Fe-S protein